MKIDMEIVEHIEIDPKTRMEIRKLWAKNGWGYFVGLQQKTLWWWNTRQIINDGWDRVYGFSSLERAQKEAQKIKENYLN